MGRHNEKVVTMLLVLTGKADSLAQYHTDLLTHEKYSVCDHELQIP